MKSFYFALMLISTALYSQDVSRFDHIDSLVRVYSQMASANNFQTVYGNLMLEGNKTKSIRFLKQTGKVQMIIIEDTTARNRETYYLQENKLFFWESSVDNQTVYFKIDKAYIRKKKGLKEVNPKLWTINVENYLSLFKEQLKN